MLIAVILITVRGQTTVDIIESRSDLSILNGLLDRLELKGTLEDINATIFAPTNAAFIATGIDLASTPNETLVTVLTYHVSLNSTLSTTNLQDGQQIVTLNSEIITVRKPSANIGLEDSTGMIFITYFT